MAVRRKPGIQGDLFATAAPSSTEALRRYLAEAGCPRVELVLTRNRVAMASVKFVTDGHVRLRLHEQFLTAPREVLEALALYLRSRRRKAWNTVAAFARTIDTSAEAHPACAERLRQKGRVHDLREIGKAVNRRFFNGHVKYRIGWGRQRPVHRRRRGRRGCSIRYGSWSQATRTIRVHPLLDDRRVPRRFVEYIVFHEMLHAVVPHDRAGDCRRDHPEAFRHLERSFPDFEAMQVLARELLDRLV